jgi:AcrR family transcriptional regulator
MTAPIRARRTQIQRRRASERALIAAAAEIIAERGIDGASLATIGGRAGTSRALATFHFGSKDALIARVARSAQDRLTDVLLAAFEKSERDPAEVSGLEALRTSVDTYLELFDHPTPEDRVLIVMWGATFPSESSIEGMLDADRRAYDGWAALIERGQHDGSIRHDLDAAASAVVLHGMLRGVAALLLTESDFTDMTSVRVTVDAWITSALASPATPKRKRP